MILPEGLPAKLVNDYKLVLKEFDIVLKRRQAIENRINKYRLAQCHKEQMTFFEKDSDCFNNKI